MKRREFLKTTAGLTAAFSLAACARERAQEQASESSQFSAIPRRILGKTGMEVSILALGGVIGMSLPPEGDHDPTAIAERAYELGINYFDTAPGYGDGQSETNMGPVIAAHRDDIFLATKVHYPRGYDNAMESVEASIKRLQTDHFDLLQIHMLREEEDVRGWDEADGVYRALQELREQGVTKYIGVTGHWTTGPLIDALNMYEFDTLLTTLNPTSNRKDFREKLIPTTEEKNIGLVAMKVFGGGNGCLASGNPKNDKIYDYHDATDNQVAGSDLLRYVLGMPISTATMGVDSIAQLEENVRTASEMEPMAAAEMARLEELVG